MSQTFTFHRALFLGLALGLLDSSLSAQEPAMLRFYIGTNTRGDSRGIYTAQFDKSSGRVEQVELACEARNPSFLALHPRDSTLLYAVGEIPDEKGTFVGGVTSYRRDLRTGRLTVINSVSSGGAGPCHINVDSQGKTVVVANYGGGTVASLPIGERGELQPAASVMVHRGHSVNPARQQEPHAHSVNFSLSGQFVFAADLGLDQVLVYRHDPQSGSLRANDPPFASVAAGSGPRHLALHPGERFAYVINELGNTVTVFQFAADEGKLTSIQQIGTLPADFEGESYTAEVLVHPTGKFLYGSNRGHDSIAVFAIDAQNGRLELLGHHSTGGKTPRNFALDPSGQWLLAENQNSNSIVVFKIDLKTGRLQETGMRAEVPSPICIRFAK